MLIQVSSESGWCTETGTYSAYCVNLNNRQSAAFNQQQGFMAFRWPHWPHYPQKLLMGWYIYIYIFIIKPPSTTVIPINIGNNGWISDRTIYIYTHTIMYIHRPNYRHYRHFSQLSLSLSVYIYIYDMYWVIPSCITINNHSHQHWTILWASMGSRHYLDGPWEKCDYWPATVVLNHNKSQWNNPFTN